jgi:hypothetical protein
MCTEHPISDEQLNAFIDNELDTPEWTHMVEAIHRDGELATRVCALRHQRDLVQMAYHEAPRPIVPIQPGRPRARVFPRVAASLMLLLVGMSAGWMGYSHFGALGPGTAASIQDREDIKGIVVHIATADPERLTAALDDAEELLNSYRSRSQPVHLEIVANAEGINMLRAEASPYSEHIKQLAERYENLSFLACSRAIEKLRLKGIQVRLLPQAQVIPGALEAIVARLQQGWGYIKV